MADRKNNSGTFLKKHKTLGQKFNLHGRERAGSGKGDLEDGSVSEAEGEAG